MNEQQTTIGAAAAELFPNHFSDIPCNARQLKLVRNRPYLYSALGAGVLILFMALAPKYWLPLTITLVLFIGVVFLNRNHPVIACYEGFLVCFNHKDPNRIQMIPDEDLIDWNTNATGSAYLEVHFRKDGQECRIVLPTINTFGVENALDSYYEKKSLRYLQAEKIKEDERNRLKKKREARTRGSKKQ